MKFGTCKVLCISVSLGLYDSLFNLPNFNFKNSAKSHLCRVGGGDNVCCCGDIKVGIFWFIPLAMRSYETLSPIDLTVFQYAVSSSLGDSRSIIFTLVSV